MGVLILGLLGALSVLAVVAGVVNLVRLTLAADRRERGVNVNLQSKAS